ncbi:MAG: hypothetical protein QNJ81_13185 [Acidimicrobiia bacterium]|nr:hypothetical protein [Acidimicrobiia bacterium]
MGLSSEDARRIRFPGTATSYDGAEVEAFRREVIETLQAHEAALLERGDPTEDEMAAAQRVRQEAVALAEQMLRDVMSAGGEESEGIDAWQDAAMLRAVAQEKMSFATEESRRLTAMATAERDAIRTRYAQERRELRAELQRELQESREAATAEAEEIRAAGRDEAAEIVKRAVSRADETHRTTNDETHRVERRLAILHTALADAEARFRRLAALAANDLGSLEALLSQDPGPPPDGEDVAVSAVDLTDQGLHSVADDAETEIVGPGLVDKDPDVGFYQRRLAGLRDRLEKSGHPPE